MARRTKSMSASLNCSTIAEGHLERKISDTVQFLTHNYLEQLHLGHMTPDDVSSHLGDRISLEIDIQRDRHSGNGLGLIVTVGE